MNVNLIGLCATSEPFSLNVDWFQKMNIMQDRTFHVFWEVFFSEKKTYPCKDGPVVENFKVPDKCKISNTCHSWYTESLGGLRVTNPPIRLMCPTSVCPSTFFVSGL